MERSTRKFLSLQTEWMATDLGPQGSRRGEGPWNSVQCPQRIPVWFYSHVFDAPYGPSREPPPKESAHLLEGLGAPNLPTVDAAGLLREQDAPVYICYGSTAAGRIVAPKCFVNQNQRFVAPTIDLILEPWKDVLAASNDDLRSVGTVPHASKYMDSSVRTVNFIAPQYITRHELMTITTPTSPGGVRNMNSFRLADGVSIRQFAGTGRSFFRR
jgi:hypothetical protein